MGSLAENKVYYDHYDWTDAGECWASRWRGTDVQWYGTILPRIQIFLPAPTILELGCGHGRLSRFLRPHCDRLILVDMTTACIDECRKRFRDQSTVDCLLGNGMSLEGVANSSVDFIFSFFSLVHADAATMRAYIVEISRTLNPTGAAFVHHSNARACRNGNADENALLHDYRDAEVSGATIEAYAREVDLTCRGQELFGWDSDQLPGDCFSVLVKPGSPWARRNRVTHNREFALEAERLGRLAEIYGAHGYAT